MATTRRETILAALKTVLTGIAGYTASRNLARPYQADELPALNLVDGGQDLSEEYTGLRAYTLRADIEICVSDDGEESDGAELNAAYGAVLAAIEADRTLGVAGVIDTRDVGLSDPEVDDRGAPTYWAVLGLEIDFETAEGDPTSAP